MSLLMLFPTFLGLMAQLLAEPLFHLAELRFRLHHRQRTKRFVKTATLQIFFTQPPQQPGPSLPVYQQVLQALGLTIRLPSVELPQRLELSIIR